YYIWMDYMKRKLIVSVIVIILLIGTISSAFTFAGRNKSNPIKIITATDIHYLSPNLTDYGNIFQETINRSDGKVIQYIDEIMSAFSDEIISAAPDVLILSGDLSFNGEKESHIALADKLAVIQESGIQVLVIPGNHDINSKSAASFFGDKYEYVSSVTADEFKDIYWNFGMSQAESVDKYSLSYLYKVNSDLCILMLDTNAYGENFVQDESYEWIEEQLKKARKEHMKVITVSHQNLFAHNSLLSFGYQLYDASDLLELYNKYKVTLNLSGHIHMQHYMKDGVTEVATSSLAVSPNQYGIIDFSKNKFIYSTKAVDVSSWAEKNNITDKHLLDFASYSADFFKNKTRTSEIFKEMNLQEEDKKCMAETFADINANYFAGVPTDKEKYEKGIALWKKQEGIFSFNYINSMLEDSDTDYCSITVK
ncbi:MAG: metallophosphoesterase, partial [Eubacterium sp.]|nr:metallophosphoesterase [Eubacterium sp.]